MKIVVTIETHEGRKQTTLEAEKTPSNSELRKKLRLRKGARIVSVASA